MHYILILYIVLLCYRFCMTKDVLIYTFVIYVNCRKRKFQ